MVTQSNYLGTMAETDAVAKLMREAEGSARGTAGQPPTPAATVIPLRDTPAGPEVLMLRRVKGGAFSGMWVFPGGKVEAEDYQGLDPTSGEDAEIAIARRAAAREAIEEAHLELPIEELVVHSFWIPPAEVPRRFSTWFFVAPVRHATEIVVGADEIHAYRWIRPAEALELRPEGNFPLAPPTGMTLHQLSLFSSVDALLAEAASRPPNRFITRAFPQGESAALTWAPDAAYDTGDLDAPGSRRRLWVVGGKDWRIETDPPFPSA